MAMKPGDPDWNNLVDDVFPVGGESTVFLDGHNLGACWKAGYAERLGKPVMCTCERAKLEVEKTHFDTIHHLTIVWDKDSQNSGGENLKATIRATLHALAKQEDS